MLATVASGAHSKALVEHSVAFVVVVATVPAAPSVACPIRSKTTSKNYQKCVMSARY